MKIEPIEDKNSWDSFFKEAGSPSFLQAWGWGEFNMLEGHKIFRLGIHTNGKLVGVALVIKIASRRGTFLLVPHGPVLQAPLIAQGAYDQGLEKHQLFYYDALSALKTELVKLGTKEGCTFIRVAPTLPSEPVYQDMFKKLGFSKAPIYMHSERVWVLPLKDKSEDELLAGMRKTTRYLIRKADKDGVKIELRDDNKAIDDFWKIYKVTADREKFMPFSKTYIQHEFEAFKKDGDSVFLFGSHDGRILASALVIFTPSTGFYHQGASIHTPVPVTYALQWRAIQEAIKRGCHAYNFWGILQEGRTPKAWGGLTLFKKGFGGEQIDYVPTQDYVLSPKYALTYMYERYLALKRGV